MKISTLKLVAAAIRAWPFTCALHTTTGVGLSVREKVMVGRPPKSGIAVFGQV